MIFEREGARPIRDPSADAIASELKELRSYGPSSFASLTRDDGSYVQVAGGGVGCMLEWRDVHAKKHWRAFVEHAAVPFGDGTQLSFSGGRVSLRSDEWIHIRLVIDVFTAFLGARPFPKDVHWRDISSVVV